MRLVIAYTCFGRAGGIESYLEAVIPQIAQRHEVVLLADSECASPNDQLALPQDLDRWTINTLGPPRVSELLRDFRPNAIYSHGLQFPNLEGLVLQSCPGLYFAHSYYGCCITGARLNQRPVLGPCQKQFGWTCLLHYFPRGCGGSNALTMSRLFQDQRRRQRLLSRYTCIATATDYMRDVYLRHANTRVVTLGLPQTLSLPVGLRTQSELASDTSSPWRILFLGRHFEAKGGDILIRAASLVAHRLGKRLEVIFAGDGPAHLQWDRIARIAERDEPLVSFRFVGWQDSQGKADLFRDVHLLAMPSIWPEPFGLVGIEAGTWGIPCVAFAVGGIPEWLKPGINGYLAENPISPQTLAAAIVKCLRDRDQYQKLRDGAVSEARKYSLEGHCHDLETLLTECAGRNSS